MRRNPGRMTVLCLIGIQTVFGESNGPNVKQIEQPAAITASCTFMGDAACWSDAVHSLCEYHLLEMLPTLASFADRRPVRIETTHVLMSKVYTVCALFWRSPDPHSLTALAQHDWEGALGSCRCEAQRCCSV